MERTLYQCVVYNIGYYSSLFAFRLYHRIRYINWRKVPKTGPVVIIANHQSFLDPVAVGTSLWRPLHYMARSTLFRGILGHLLRAVGAYPVEQEGGSAFSAIKETLRLLKKGEAVVMFPEGSRTFDGHMQPFQGGIVMIARKAKVPIITCSINGAFHAYPRQAKFPRPRKVTLTFGDVIPVEEIQKLTNEELLKLLEERIAENLWEDAKPLPVTASEMDAEAGKTEGAEAGKETAAGAVKEAETEEAKDAEQPESAEPAKDAAQPAEMAEQSTAAAEANAASEAESRSEAAASESETPANPATPDASKEVL